MAQENAPKGLALLDREGTIMIAKVYLSDTAGIESDSTAIEGQRLLRDAGFALVFITNQSRLAPGYFTLSTFEEIHERLWSMLAGEGLRLDAIYFYPYGPDDRCNSRRPAPGMVRTVLSDLGFVPNVMLVIGHSETDMGAAAGVGVAGVRVWSAGNAPARGAGANFVEAARHACDPLAEREGGEAT